MVVFSFSCVTKDKIISAPKRAKAKDPANSKNETALKCISNRLRVILFPFAWAQRPEYAAASAVCFDAVACAWQGRELMGRLARPVALEVVRK